MKKKVLKNNLQKWVKINSQNNRVMITNNSLLKNTTVLISKSIKPHSLL